MIGFRSESCCGVEPLLDGFRRAGGGAQFLRFGRSGILLAILTVLGGCKAVLSTDHSGSTGLKSQLQSRADTAHQASRIPAIEERDRSVITAGGEQTSSGVDDASKADSRIDGIEDPDQAGMIKPAKIRLSLVDAFGLALAQNGDVRIMSIGPREIETGIDQELALFDPRMLAGGQWANINQQAQSTVQALGTGINRYESSLLTGPAGVQDQLQFSKTWQTGTRTRLGYGTNYSYNPTSGQFLLINPAWNSGLSVGVEQPILQGAGKRQNQLGILIARSRLQQSHAELRAGIHSTLFNLQRSYWDVYRNVQYVGSVEQNLAQAEVILKREEKRLETGSGSAVDVAQAREGVESLRAELSESRLRREGSLDRLRNALGLAADDQRPIELTEEPRSDPFEPDLDDGIAAAMQSRAELVADQQAMKTARLSLEQAEGLLKPSLVANASYRFSGLGTNIGSSVNELQGFGNGNWGIGLSFDQPLGDRKSVV